mmetsp:Transcript_6476/g.12970  ORF Transcript_6476/g.12970 Transcript_6476/m.12970 type:complete len:118 (-) Transcript_6476:1794-2147(-)
MVFSIQADLSGYVGLQRPARTPTGPTILREDQAELRRIVGILRYITTFGEPHVAVVGSALYLQDERGEKGRLVLINPELERAKEFPTKLIFQRANIPSHVDSFGVESWKNLPDVRTQ